MTLPLSWSSIRWLLLTFNLIVVVIYLYSRYKLNYWRRRGVEQLPNTHWFFGNFKKAVFFQSAPGWYLGELYRQLKPETPMVGFYVFQKPCLLLRDPKIIKQILIKDFEEFSDRGFAGSTQKDSIGMRNLFGLKNPAWKYLRNKITPTLNCGKLKQMFPLLLESGEPMMQFIKEQTEEGKVAELDAQDLNYKYCTDIIANVALGTKMDSFNNPNSEFTKAVMEFFHSFKRMIALISVFFMPELVDLIGSPLRFNIKFVQNIFWKALEKREKTGDKRGDYVDSIIQLKNGDQNPVYKFEGENLLFQSGMFFSGFESSSAAAAFTLMELARHKEYQDRAREKIQEAIKQHGWSYEAFNEMKFVEQCILESMRLHPPVSTIDRCARKDYQIPDTNITIEKGTTLFISLYGIQVDNRFFKDPLVYDPKRFSRDKIISEAYIPFGTGPRMCVGMKLGLLHVKVVIAMILSQYELHNNPDRKTDLDPRSTFTAAADGISINFRKLAA